MVKKHRHKGRTRVISKGFVMTLALVSLLGFGTIVLNHFFQFDIGKYTTPLLMIILGTGFMIMGQVKLLLKRFKGGLTSDEFSHIITSTIGAFSFMVGFLLFFIENSPVLNAMTGIIASLAILMIVLETWVFK